MSHPQPTIRKFTFDTEFRDKKVFISEEARARQRHSLSAEQIEELRSAARAEGLQCGQVRAAEKTASAVELTGRALHDVLAMYHQDIEAVREEAVRIALAAARKLAGATLAVCPEKVVEDTLRTAITQAMGEPRVILRAPAPVVEALTPRLEEIAQSEGYGGALSIAVDPSLSGTDCRVEWQGGGLEHCLETVDAAISAIIGQRFAGKV